MNESTLEVLFFILSQLAIIVMYFIAFLLAGQCITAGYIAALERKINKLANQDITIWESFVTLETFIGWKSAYFWGQLIIGFVMVTGLFTTLVLSMKTIGGATYGAALFAEVSLGVLLFVAGYGAKKKAMEIAIERLLPPVPATQDAKTDS